MNKDEILKKYEDDNEYHFHQVDREWIMEAMQEYAEQQLRFIKTLPIQDLSNCTRVEVIDQKGRSYVNWKPTNKVKLSMQDEGRTIKIFIE